MFSMHYTASLTVIVMAFGGILEKCGILDEILSTMKGLTRTGQQGTDPVEQGEGQVGEAVHAQGGGGEGAAQVVSAPR